MFKWGKNKSVASRFSTSSNRISVAISVITDLCDPENLEPINIKEIIDMGKKGEKQLLKILIKLLQDV